MAKGAIFGKFDLAKKFFNKNGLLSPNLVVFGGKMRIFAYMRLPKFSKFDL